MILIIILLRIIHIVGGVFWVGFGLVNVGFLQPTAKALGPDSQKMMQHLTQKTRLLSTVYIAATLTVLSGLLLYWIVFGFNFAFMYSGHSVILTSASIAGIIGWFIAVFIIRGIFNQIKVLGRQVQASGNPPSPEQAGQMQALLGRLGILGKITIVFLLVSLVGMSIARYVSF